MARQFDAIVIGSGLGGLTAGALYARSGRRVLLLERNDYFGGAATVYRHGALAIETSLHEIDGLDEHDPKLPLLCSLGLEDHIRFVDVGDFYEIRSPLLGKPFVLPHGVETARAATLARFPRHAEAIEAYFGRLISAGQAIRMAAWHQDERIYWLRHPIEAGRLWAMIRAGHASLGDVLDALFGADEGIKIALSANFSYFHDDIDQIAFQRYAIAQSSYLAGGYYVHGGSQALSDRLAELIREAGGIVENGREADAILIDDARVAAVRHHARGGGDQQIDTAQVVFGNAAPQRLAEMLPPGSRQAFLAPYAARRPSISLWTVSLGLDRSAREFGVRRYSTYVFPGWMTTLRQLRETGRLMSAEPGTRLPPYIFVDYDQIDSGLNAQGPSLCTLCGIDRCENWAGLSGEEKRVRKDAWMNRLTADLDRHYPGIAAAIVQREMATAETMRRYLNTPDGAIYGFAPLDLLSQTSRFTPRTAIKGLWLASAFTLGGGFSYSMLGGAAAARAALAADVGMPSLRPWASARAQSQRSPRHPRTSPAARSAVE
jgi:all-trans-retinol 13,14-reductase